MFRKVSERANCSYAQQAKDMYDDLSVQERANGKKRKKNHSQESPQVSRKFGQSSNGAEASKVPSRSSTKQM